MIAGGLALPASWLGGIVVRTCAGQGDRPSIVPIALAVLGAFLWAGAVAPPEWILASSLTLGWTLVCLTAVDVTSFRLPDVLTLPLIVIGLSVSLMLPGTPILDHLAGAAIGYGALAILAFGYRRLRGVDGIGLGDAKLLAAAGAWLGWSPLPSVVLIACAAAFLWIAARRITRGRRVLTERIAFGAPLCLAIWIVWLHGPLIV